MKTVMQEVYDNFNLMSDSEFKAWMLNTDLLKKEKNIIIDFAYECRNIIPAYESPLILHRGCRYAITKSYNETFNTKEMEKLSFTIYTEHCPYCDSENITMIGDTEYNDEWECDDCEKQFSYFKTKEI